MIPCSLKSSVFALQYWYDSYDIIRCVSLQVDIVVRNLTSSFREPYGTSQQSNTVVMIHDAFQPISYWKDFMPSPKWEGVLLDTHIYQMFSPAVSAYLQRGSSLCNLFEYRGIS